MIKILIVEDNIGLNQGIQLALKSEFYRFFSAYTLKEAKQILGQNKIDLILLDINLPDGTGYSLLTEVRSTSQIPIIMLTADNMELDEVKGLTLGADDYITKPFSLMVLRARIERLLTRMSCIKSLVFQDKEYIFDFENLYFEKKGEEIILSKAEQKVLKILVEHPGKTITRDLLIDRIWSDESEFVDENALSVTINRLRKKLDDKNVKSHIRTIYGLGYVWEVTK